MITHFTYYLNHLITKVAFSPIFHIGVISLMLISLFFIPIEYFNSQTKAQTGFRIEQLPFDSNLEIVSYVDHDGKSNGGLDGTGPFMFMNGDSYTNQLPYFYDGHNGIDWPVQEVNLRAVASGTVIFKQLEQSTYGYMIRIDHGAYVSVYAHLKKFSDTNIVLNEGDVVTQGQVIAISGNTAGITETWGYHLHFEIRHPDESMTDPFGWRGEPGQDPLAYNGVDSQCLWNNEWCQETIVEDRDFPITGTAHYEEIVGEPPTEDMWFDTDGNQNGARYLLSRSFSAYARWKPTLPMKGRYEIFAFIPPSNATTQNAIYKINTVNGLVTATVNQNANPYATFSTPDYYFHCYTYSYSHTYEYSHN